MKTKEKATPEEIFDENDKLPERMESDEPESIEVGVIIEGEHFEGYYDHDRGNWWIDFGGITVGHRLYDDDYFEGWYYLDKKNEKKD